MPSRAAISVCPRALNRRDPDRVDTAALENSDQLVKALSIEFQVTWPRIRTRARAGPVAPIDALQRSFAPRATVSIPP